LMFATQERTHFPFKLAPFPLATEVQSAKMVGVASRRCGVDFRRLKEYISECKRYNVTPHKAVELAEKQKDAKWGSMAPYAIAYKCYQDACEQEGVMDFDSLVMEMGHILDSQRDVLHRWQYRFVQVDESQDADAGQWRLVRLISSLYRNVFAVGDVGQCVYQWRSALPELFLDFPKYFDGAKTLYLAQNYRSTRSIVDFCKEIAPVKELGDRFYTQNEQGEKPAITRYGTNVEEAENVSFRVGGLGGGTNAILARTNRQLRLFEEFLADWGVKYHLLGKSGFWQQNEIKALLHYVQLAHQPFDSAVIGAIRAPFFPSRFVQKMDVLNYLKQGKTEESSYMSLLSEYRSDNLQQHRAVSDMYIFFKALRFRFANMTAGRAVRTLIEDIKALDYYKNDDELDNSPAENIEEFARIADRFNSVGDLLQHARRVQRASRVKKGVAVGTVHQSKGKEFDNVFVVGASEGSMPHAKGDLDEEKRIFFVACSRAAKRLYISYSGTPSRFIPKDRL